MKSILEELYYGNVFPAEQICPENPEYRQVNRKISEIKEYFLKKSSEEDKEKLQELEISSGQSSSMELADTFAYGFRMATLLMTDIFFNIEK